MANLTYFLNRRAISAQELHEADGQQLGPAAGLVDAVQGVGHGQPSDRNPFLFQAFPWKVVGRELLPKPHHPVAWLPIQTEGHGCDALGSVLDERDFRRVRAGQPRGGGSQAAVHRQPFDVVQAAEIQAVVCQVFHGVGGGLAQRRHGGVVQVYQPPAHGELVCVNLPKRRFVYYRGFQSIAHLIYNTVLRTLRTVMKRSSAAILCVVFFAVAYGAEHNKKNDPTQIGNRDVGKGVNFYSLQKEMALGRQLAQEVQRQAKMVDDPLIAEFVNRLGQNTSAPGLNFYSLQKEMALGRQLAQEVQRQAKMVDDPLIAEFVNRLGQNLARNSDAKVPFTFHVVDAPALNAFALPGGYVFVNAGLIEIADDEDELAGAMAHEIAHVAARHMTRQATKSQLAKLAAAPLGAVLGGWTGYAATQGAGVAIPMTFLSFGR